MVAMQVPHLRVDGPFPFKKELEEVEGYAENLLSAVGEAEYRRDMMGDGITIDPFTGEGFTVRP